MERIIGRASGHGKRSKIDDLTEELRAVSPALSLRMFRCGQSKDLRSLHLTPSVSFCSKIQEKSFTEGNRDNGGASRGLPLAACRLPLAACRLPSAACLLPLAFCRLPSAFCRLPSAFCLLPLAFCRLPYALCLVFSFTLPASAHIIGRA